MGENAMKVRLREIHKTYRIPAGNLPVLQGIDLEIRSGEFVSLIGPSGCGKSTIFNILSGLEVPDRGSVALDGKEVTGRTGHVSYMMQKDCLLPWRTVLDNAILGAEVRGLSRRKAREKARELLPVFGLTDFADEYPSRLSGGMRQRAALLRTAVTGRDLWLLDEPFGSLDALTREQMQDWLLGIRDRFGHTIGMITHSIDEAIYLSDRIYVFTPRPARVKEILTVDLPRPRSRRMVTQEPFLRCKERLWRLLHEEEAADNPGTQL
jgi:ABC-type nitrate/sulfonate/bicarbonate transport system ATPase subunit